MSNDKNRLQFPTLSRWRYLGHHRFYVISFGDVRYQSGFFRSICSSILWRRSLSIPYLDMLPRLALSRTSLLVARTSVSQSILVSRPLAKSAILPRKNLLTRSSGMSLSPVLIAKRVQSLTIKLSDISPQVEAMPLLLLERSSLKETISLSNRLSRLNPPLHPPLAHLTLLVTSKHPHPPTASLTLRQHRHLLPRHLHHPLTTSLKRLNQQSTLSPSPLSRGRSTMILSKR